MQSEKILVVDDDRAQTHLIRSWLEKAGFEAVAFSNGEDCLHALPQTLPSAVCLDLHMPGLSGLETLQRIRSRHPALPVLILTSDDQVETVMKATRLGAFDYLTKPVQETALLNRLKNAIESYRMSLRLAGLEREASGEGFAGMVGNSASMQALFRQMDRLSQCDITTLIQGESGTGKELVAQAIHEQSSRRKAEFVAVNCAAIPETLQESELFGHEKGSFTGAADRRIGRFEQADGGTLFLDEIAELSAPAQAKLLRVLQERTFRRLGGNRELSSDFRLVAATHRDLQERVAENQFREDLYFRVAVYEIEVPPLRQRQGDTAALARHFADRYAGREGRNTPTLAPDLLGALSSYRWPGNVRELENAVQRALVACDGVVLSAQHLPPRILRELEVSGGVSSLPLESKEDHVPLVDAAGATRTLDEIERDAILSAVERLGGNLSKVCKELGIGRTTLYRKLRKYGVHDEDE
ncbi:MAG: sigma-54 dependent transcriptional regulator [Acidobacteriota bacterium]